MIIPAFIDDQATVNTRIAEHEAHLGLPHSGPHDDIAKSNVILRGLTLLETPAKPAAPAVAAVQPSAAPVPSPAPKVATGHQRLTRAFASGQSAARLNDAPGFPDDGKLHGVSLLAAHYAKHG